MELLQAIYGRRAVRAYTRERVADGQIEALVDAAIQAPSALNRQPWSFCVVRDPVLLARISNEAKALMLRNPPAGLPSHELEQMLADPDFDIFYQAPVLILISAVEPGTWSLIDCALAAENLMLAAFGMGLGSCWIGLAQAWLDTAEGKAALGLPAGHAPIAPIIVGYPAEAVPRVQRNTPAISWIGRSRQEQK
jgi:nitroreductase